MKISLSAIKHNPHRNMKRNPVTKEQVQVILDSFERNGIWPNVVVRKDPKSTNYQLAYGHHRLAAMKKAGLKEADFIVQKIDDWGMYTAMVDENEGQKRMTPELIYENIESGINYIEPLVKKCKTLDEFKSMVPMGTAGMDESAYSTVYNCVKSGEGLGVKFLQKILPGDKSTRPANIQAVVDSHYKATKAQAKTHRAKAKRKLAAAEKDMKKAEALEAEAKKLEAEAEKAAAGGVDKDILLSFSSPRAMTDFSSAVKALKIPAERHADAAAYLLNKANGIALVDYRRKLDAWWYKLSGRAAKDQREAKRQQWKKKHKSVSMEDFAAKLVSEMKELRKKTDALAEFAPSLNNKVLAKNVQREIEELTASISSLYAALKPESQLKDIEDDTPMLDVWPESA